MMILFQGRNCEVDVNTIGVVKVVDVVKVFFVLSQYINLYRTRVHLSFYIYGI